MLAGAARSEQNLRRRGETSSMKGDEGTGRRVVAEQLEFFPVQSPCRGICQTDERGYCRGCFRSREERFNWQTMSDAQKQEVLRLCRQRLLRKIRANRPEPAEEPQQPSLF